MPKHGIVEVDPSGRVTSFLEKPAVRETQSRKQSPCFYLLSRPAVSGLKAESNTIRSVVSSVISLALWHNIMYIM